MNLKSKLKKLVSGFTAAVMCMTMLPSVSFTSSAASPGDKLSVGNGMSQHKGVSDGYSYEIWIDQTGGSGTMTLGQGATFKAEWSANVSAGNFLARRGLDFGSTKKATDYPYIGMDYEADYRQTGSANGNSRLCVYGWFQNKGLAGVPLVEYYIIEDWVDWCPDAAGKMVTIDGAQYKIFQMDHTGPTINGGSETFKQYFSVRQSKRKSGHITVSDHFKAWADQGWGIGNLYEVALNAEGWQSSGVADITKLDVYTDPNGGSGDITPTPTPDPEPEISYTAPSGSGSGVTDDFEGSGTDWAARGDVSYGFTNDFAHGGKKSLYVTDRTESWHGFTISDSELVAGGDYEISAYTGFKSNNYDSLGFTLGLQYDDASGETQYENLFDGTGSSGKWTELGGEFSIPAGASNISLYVQSAYAETSSASDLVSFFLDDVVLTKKGGNTNPTPTPDPTPTPSGDSLVGKFGGLFKMGTSVSPNELSQSAGSSFIKKHFNSITPENELKPDAIIDQTACQQKGNNVNTQVNLSRAAQTLSFCEDNNIGVRGHTFIWHSQTPDWFFRENFSNNGAYVSKEVMDQRIESFIKNTFAALKAQYPNLNLYAYDVANELFLNDGGGMRGVNATSNSAASNWARIYGEENDEFVYTAFRAARKYAPADCKLYINDYNEYIPAKTQNIYDLAMGLKAEGLIDGIGMQSHLDVGYPSASVYETALKKFLSTGLEVSITELDITTSNKDFDAQADLFKAIFELAVENADQIPSFTVWGTNDSISWRGSQDPLLFSAGYVAKPAYTAVMGVDTSDAPVAPVTTAKPDNTNPTTTKPVTGNILYGDANCDGNVTLADATAILQSLANPDKYGLSAEGAANADVDGVSGVSGGDALVLKQYYAGTVDSLPIGGVKETTDKNNTVTTKVPTVAATEYFNNNFDSSVGDWEGRGGALVELNSDNYYSGKSLYVSGRTDYWHGASIALDTSDFKAGNTYSFSGAVLQRSGESTTMKMTLQYNLNGEEMYDEVASATVKSNQWTKLENTSFTIPAGATGCILYVEAPDSLTNFYIDNFVGATEGTKSSVTTGKGTVQSGTDAPEAVTPPVSSGTIDPSKPMMAISFDDGTDPNGKKIIDALAKEGFAATFFYVGNWISDESQVKYAYENGMEVANHTTTHPYLTQKSASEIRSEYDQCYNKLKKIIGAEPSKLLRLPYLASNGTVQSTLSDAPLITCKIDTQDWNGASKDQIVNTVKKAMADGSADGAIILAHETYASTAAAIEELAPYAKAQGWQIVTISDMYAAKGKALTGGQVHTGC